MASLVTALLSSCPATTVSSDSEAWEEARAITNFPDIALAGALILAFIDSQSSPRLVEASLRALSVVVSQSHRIPPALASDQFLVSLVSRLSLPDSFNVLDP
ncbi:hypothetical protein HDU83_007861, partial [Entophlyctis luteolus]